jgi:hypothetical protein
MLVVLSIQIDGCEGTTVANVNTNEEISPEKIAARLLKVGVSGRT